MQKFKTTLAGIQGLKKGKISRVNLSKSIFLGIALTVLSQNEAKAQLSATGQIRERTELRAGQGTLQKDGDKAGLFTSQRARLNIGCTGYRFKIYTSFTASFERSFCRICCNSTKRL